MPAMTVAATQEAPASGKKIAFREMFVTADGRNHIITFVLVSTLFALWGQCNGMLDILNKHFQNSLHINKFQSAFVQSANFMGYFVMALPAGALARRFGYKGGIIIGLSLIAAGAFWFIPATYIGTFGAFLAGLFVLACGLACLETVANPYATVLGPLEGAAARINIAQSFNGVGLIAGPIIGGAAVFSDTAEVNRSNASLYIPYLGIAIIVTVLAVIFAIAKVPDVRGEAVAGGVQKAGSLGALWRRPHFSFAVLAQFLYVAAQIGVWGFFINYMVAETPPISPGMADLLPNGWTALKNGVYVVTDHGAGRFLVIGFVLFLVGRITGSMALRRLKAHSTLALYAAINAGLMLLVLLPLGWLSVAALFLCNFFMSIMFPTIFSLGLHGLGEETKRASSYIVMSIVGGAVIPLLLGWIADHFGMRIGFVVPMVCFAGVFVYGTVWEKLERRSRLVTA
jgi:FHS family L-fucose permease-like MFS transporter